MSDSLVRVSRRVDKRHFVKVPHTQKSKIDLTSSKAFGSCARKLDALPAINDKQQHCLPSVPFQQFQVLFNSLFKVLFIFPSRYLFAIGLPSIFSFRWNLPPTLSCNPKQLDSLTIAPKARRTGVSPSQLPCSKGLGPASNAKVSRPQFDARGADSQGELHPFHSPLLRISWLVSFPPLNYMLKFSGSSCLS